MRILLLLLFAYISCGGFAQSVVEIKPEDIKDSGFFFWGQSPVCDSYEDAEKKATKAMFKNIVNTGEFDLIEFGTDRDGHIEKIIESFKFKIDNNKYKKIINIKNDTKNDEYSCLVYISKEDFDALCDDRTNELQRRFKLAQMKEDDNVMVDALREYYWSLMICVAHPQGNKLTVDVDGDELHAYTYLYDHITEVLDSFTFAISKDNPGEIHEDGISVILNVRTYGDDVSELKIKYHNGLDARVSTIVRNGKVQLELSNPDIEKIDIQIEYDFMHELEVHHGMKVIMDNVDKVVMKKNVRREVDLQPYLRYFKGADEIKPGDVVAGTSLKENQSYYLSVMQNIETSFRSHNYDSVRQYFTTEAYAMLDTLIRSAKVSVVGVQEYKFIELDNRTMCYDIDMKFEFRNHASFIREVVFRFDNNTRLISSLAFRLSSIAENDIIKKSKWDNESKLALISFLEDYQTAYALKRYDYLESIFSDDALIIVGHVVEKMEPEDMKDVKVLNLPQKQIDLLRMDKNKYFERMSRLFNSQEYINIRFTETDFTRQKNSSEEDKKGEDIFGVRLLQEYKSTTYGDVGYLFLMVDLRDKIRPMIHVRAWQPDKTDLDNLVGLKDIR